MRMISTALGMVALCALLSACQRGAEPVANSDVPEAAAPTTNSSGANTDETAVNEGVDANTTVTEQGSTDHGSTDHGSTDH